MEQNSTLDYLSEMSPDELLEYIKEEEARKGLLDFIMFTKEDYEPAWFHEIVCSEIDSFLESETDNRLIITISPRRGKSEIVSRRTPAYVLGKNPNTSIIVASYSADLAQRINRDVQRIIDSPKYRILFPETTLSGKNVKTTSLGSYVRTSDLFEIVGYKGALRSAGVGGGITGTGGDLCGKFDTPILTCYGYKAINELCVGDLVWSYNHERNELELKPITNILRRRTSETVTITFRNGRKSVFTPDHPFFTTASGYVEAIDITKESQLIQETVYKSEKIQLLNKVQLLSCHIREIKYGIFEKLERWDSKLLLFTEMFLSKKKREDKHLSHSWLWECCKCAKSKIKNLRKMSGTSKYFKYKRNEDVQLRSNTERISPSTSCRFENILTNRSNRFYLERGNETSTNKNSRIGNDKEGVLQNKKSSIYSKMFFLFEKIRETKSRLFKRCSEKSKRFLLLGCLFKETFFNKNKSKMSNKRMHRECFEKDKKILRVVQESEKESGNKKNKTHSIFQNNIYINKTQRLFQMCFMPIKKVFTRSSYKLESLRRFTRKFNNNVSILSHKVTPKSFRYVDGAEVKRNSNSSVIVYDITVEGNHNFFANGILVHNCIIDDPFKDWQDAYSPRYRQMIKDWYSSTLYTRLSPKGKIIIIHTRWHEDDLIGWLLKEAEANPEADQWRVVNLPEIQDEHNNYPHPKDQRQHGEVLWSDRYSLEHVNKIKNSVGSKVFNALYQQRPTTDGGQIIKAEWIQYFKELPEIDYYIASWDCAFKDTKTSDFVVGTVWAVCGSNKYLVYLVRERMGITETMKQMIIVSKKFDLRYQVIEDKANGPAIIQMLKNKIPALLAFNPEGSKEARANAVAPQFEAGNIWIPSKYVEKNREQFGTVIAKLDEYVNELTTFPNGANDDMVDSTTQALLKIGYKSDWLEEIISRANAKEKDAVDIKTKVVADLMGWNIQEQESSIFDDLMDEDMFKVDF